MSLADILYTEDILKELNVLKIYRSFFNYTRLLYSRHYGADSSKDFSSTENMFSMEDI